MEQLSLFTLPHSPPPIPQPIHDPYWDEITCDKVDEILQPTDLDSSTVNPGQFLEKEFAPEQIQVTKGDWVKLSQDWMNNCAKVAGEKFKRDYHYKSEQDLTCQVIWVDPSLGHIYVNRGGNALFIPSGYFVRAQSPNFAPEHSNLNLDTQQADSPCDFVRAQVNSDTKKVAPEHDTHWIEEYWVDRGGNKYWYYRYCWMTKRKKNRIHIGSTTNAAALKKKEAVEIAIADGETPSQIRKLIKEWGNSQ